MQVANTLNNTIRILFNPRVESFKLFDFLLVKSLDDRYLAQIIEIYEDKFDSSQNVAKLKLFYKIAANNEVMPYDNFTPGKECEILKVKPEEVEKFINSDKDTFVFATNVKNSQGLNIQYDFFNKNAIVLADKIENANAISLNIAKKLSSKHPCVFIDFTGVVEFEESKRIKACKNFKMPLNFNTIDLVFERCLSNASLEFQATGCEIQNAIKNYSKKQEEGFIPFNSFLHVLLEQYKATPYPELQLMLAKMKRYQMTDIFARNKKDYTALRTIIDKNDITIIDLSGLDYLWQKAYMEYIVSEIQNETYLISRIHDEIFDVDLINKIYNKKQNIKFIPNVSYNYAKLPSIIQYCKNYILLPSLYQRNDFLDANFALSNLINQECIIFGENTDGFLYVARDYELEVQEKRKNYRKIALSLVNAEEGVAVSQEEPEVSDSQKLIDELSNLEEQSIKEYETEQESLREDNEEDDSKDEFTEIVQDNSTVETQQIPDEVETIKNIQEIKLSNEPFEYIEYEAEQTQKPTSEVVEQQIEHGEVKNADIIQPEVSGSSEVENNTRDEVISELKAKQDELDISDEELDFFELAENTASFENQENVVVGNVEYKVKSDNFDSEVSNIEEVQPNGDVTNDEETVDLAEFTENAIENNFEEVINSKHEIEKPKFEIDDNTTIQVDLDSENSDLPIFKEENEEDKEETDSNYEIGNSVIHKKYGRGEIIKIIPHGKNQLLQINFEDSGKKLLDPKIAEIQLEQ